MKLDLEAMFAAVRVIEAGLNRNDCRISPVGGLRIGRGCKGHDNREQQDPGGAENTTDVCVLRLCGQLVHCSVLFSSSGSSAAEKTLRHPC
jgi:hypothetical protein